MPNRTLPHRRLPTTLWISLGIIALCLFLYALTADYPGMSGMLPRLVLMMIGLVTVADIVQILRKREPRKAAPTPAPCRPDAGTRLHYDKVFYLAVLMPAFFILLRLFGVVLGTLVFVFLSGWILRYRKVGSLLAASTVVAVSVYLIFVVIMDSFLPPAYLSGLIGG